MSVIVNLNMNVSNKEYERQLSELRLKLADLGRCQITDDEEAEIERVERVGIFKGGLL